MILLRPNTYQSVAKKLAEGLLSGEIILPKDKAIIQDSRVEFVGKIKAFVERMDYSFYFRSLVTSLASALVLIPLLFLFILPSFSLIEIFAVIAALVHLSLAINNSIYAQKVKSDFTIQIEEFARELKEQDK